jgi:hypothetical protein
MIHDYEGRPLTVGARVTGWRDGYEYTGTLQHIDPPDPDCEGHRHVIVLRADTREAHPTFSDALTQPA